MGLTLILSSCAKAPTPEEVRVELGKKLYFDTRLSSTGTISCNSCHNVMTNGTDDKQVSEGVNGLKGTRNAPTVFNATHLSSQFWDGRAATLEEQAKGPMINPVEMGMKDHDAVVAVIKNSVGYKSLFDKAFPDKEESITIDTIATAIADYERTLVTTSPFDAFKAGNQSAISEEAKRGYKVFQAVGCISCHSGDHFAGPLPVGTPFLMKFPLFPSSYDDTYDLLSDKGKFEDTKNDVDKHLWRVSSLREVATTAPYFHNGRVTTLEEAVRVMGKSQLNKDLTDAEVNDIVAFLKTLSGTIPAQEAPELPH